MLSNYCTPAEERRVDAWRRDVADSSAPIIIRRDERDFRNGIPAPRSRHADDGLRFRGDNSMSSRDYPPLRRSSTRPKQPTRRSSSYDEYLPRRGSLRGGGTEQRRSKHDSYDSKPRRASFNKAGSIWSALFSSTAKHTPSRSSRPRASPYDRPPTSSRRHRSPEYVPYAPSSRTQEPEVTVYSSRPKRDVAPRREFVVNRSPTTKSSRTRSRRDSFNIDDRMRMMDIKDRVREEVSRTSRDWRDPEPRRRRRRDYDRRSSYY